MKYFLFYCFIILGGALSSCSSSEKDYSNGDEPPKLLSMKFSVDDNLYQLTEDVNCEIIGDSIVECWIRHIVPNRMLKPTCAFNGSKIVYNDVEIDNSASVDFSKPVKLSVYKGEIHKDYVINVHTFTGLPIVWIETQDRQPIVSKTDYIGASFKLEEGVRTRSAGDIVKASVNIRGRGNSSWTQTPKKSYRLKFDEKVSLFDLPQDKSWVLLANSFDKTMIRNHLAFCLGKWSQLEYTPNFKYVDLMLNGSYMGTYMLGENLKISKNRVNVGDDGFLIEVDERAPSEGEPHFWTEHLSQPINIKDPDVEAGDDNFNYIKDYVLEAEHALFSDNFMDENNGWKKYMDMDSFVDWYIIHEIARNYDALFLYTSCYLNLKRGGKLKMGPIWDFDVTFGNNTNPLLFPIEGLANDNSSWFYRLLQDPNFKHQVKNRYEYFYERKDDILREINESSVYLRYTIEENDNKWGVLFNAGFANHDVWGNYMNEVQCLKEWLNKRMDWLKSEFESY